MSHHFACGRHGRSGVRSVKKSTIKGIKKGLAVGVALLLAGGVAGNVSARQHSTTSSGTISWTGNGTTLIDGTRSLTSETCDAENTPYLLWILSGSKASSASITIDGNESSMSKANIDRRGLSTFKFLMSGTIDLDNAAVFATYDDGRNRATLTISHGCLGEESEGLTVVFLGELPSFGSLGAAYGVTTMSISVCESAFLTNCVTFSGPVAPGSSGSISMSATGILTLSQNADSCTTFLFDSGFAAGDPVPPRIAEVTFPGLGSDNTSSSFSNGDTVYVASDAAC